MRLSLAKVFVATALATLHWTASASLISPLEYQSGGLTWLQLSETAGLSLNDFSSGVGGWSKQYRVALNSEIDSLIGSFGLGLGDTGYQQYPNGTGDFVFSIGGVTESGAAGTYFYDGNQGAIGRGLGRFVSAELTNGDSPALGPDCEANFSCSRFVAKAELQPLSDRSQVVGLFVVRKEVADPPPAGVPEPSSLALLGAGVLLAFRRKKNNM